MNIINIKTKKMTHEDFLKLIYENKNIVTARTTHG